MENPGTPNQEAVNQQFNKQFAPQVPLPPVPNSTAVLVLGIVSIPACFCYFFMGIPGLVVSIIALILSNKANRAYLENPSLYTTTSYSNLKAGKICAIVGLSLNALWFLIVMVYIIFFFSIFTAAMGSSFPFN